MSFSLHADIYNMTVEQVLKEGTIYQFLSDLLCQWKTDMKDVGCVSWLLIMEGQTVSIALASSSKVCVCVCVCVCFQALIQMRKGIWGLSWAILTVETFWNLKRARRTWSWAKPKPFQRLAESMTFGGWCRFGLCGDWYFNFKMFDDDVFAFWIEILLWLMSNENDLTLLNHLRLRYHLGEDTWIEYWPTNKEGQKAEHREKFIGLTSLADKLTRFGCST